MDLHIVLKRFVGDLEGEPSGRVYNEVKIARDMINFPEIKMLVGPSMIVPNDDVVFDQFLFRDVQSCDV